MVSGASGGAGLLTALAVERRVNERAAAPVGRARFVAGDPIRALSCTSVLIYHTALANGYRLGGATFSHNYRAVAELPRQAAVDLAETAALAAGSARHRSLLL